MTIENTLHFILNEADADLPNSSVLKTNIDVLALQQSSFDPILVPSGNLKLLSEVSGSGLLVKTTDGFAARNFVSPKQTIAIENDLAEGGNITFTLNQRTFQGKINVASNGVNAANPRSKINFNSTDSMTVSVTTGPRQSASIAFTPTFNTGLEDIEFYAEPSTGDVLNLQNTTLGENYTLTFGFDTKTAGGTLKPEIRAFSPLQVDEDGVAMGWGAPIQGLESLTLNVNDGSEDALVATLTPNNPTEADDDATLSIGFVEAGALDEGFVIAKTADGYAIQQAPVTGVASVGINIPSAPYNLLSVTPETPITSDGSFTVGFTAFPTDPAFSYAPVVTSIGSLLDFEYAKVLSSFTMATDTTSEDVFTFTSSAAPNPLTYTGTYTWAFNTTGASDKDVLRYNHGTGKVEFSPGGGSDIGKLVFEIGPNAQNILSITGTSEITTSGTINYDTTPPADTSFNAQVPTLFDQTGTRDTSVLQYGTLYTGPLKYIAYAQTTFSDGASTKQIYTTTGASVGDIERYIVIVAGAILLTADQHNANRGILSTQIDYDPSGPQTLTISVVTDQPPTGGLQNIFSYFIYYKLES
jgi:hypothetical protein